MATTSRAQEILESLANNVQKLQQIVEELKATAPEDNEAQAQPAPAAEEPKAEAGV